MSMWTRRLCQAEPRGPASSCCSSCSTIPKPLGPCCSSALLQASVEGKGPHRKHLMDVLIKCLQTPVCPPTRLHPSHAHLPWPSVPSGAPFTNAVPAMDSCPLCSQCCAPGVWWDPLPICRHAHSSPHPSTHVAAHPQHNHAVPAVLPVLSWVKKDLARHEGFT